MSETLRAAAFLDKGGTGKTTTVAHLSVALEEFGYEMLLIDIADKQGYLGKHLGVGRGIAPVQRITRSPDPPAPLHMSTLRYAVLRLLEGNAGSVPEAILETNGVTVGYGRDQAMHDSWASDVEW